MARAVDRRAGSDRCRSGGAVNNGDFEVTRQTVMLQAVVAHDNVAAEPHQPFGRAGAVGVGDHRQPASRASNTGSSPTLSGSDSGVTICGQRAARPP